MYQFPIVPKTLAVVSLLVASVTLAIAQTSNVASIKGATAESRTMSFSGSVSIEESTRIIAGFLAAEARVREALNQHAFKRDVVLQTIGPSGEVTGEYIRNSQFVFDDHGKRIERVLFHPKSTIHEMRITKEDIQDLAEAQLLGIDIAEVAKYRLTYAGTETVDSIQLHAVDISPSVQPDPNHMKERYFIGRVWLDPKTFQIVKIRGIVEPQGKQRFPMFETWRKPTKDDLAFPARTEADDVLHFQNNDVHYRIKVLYYDYKLFGSQVSITDLDEPADEPSSPRIEPKASDPSKEQPNKGNRPKTRRPAKTNAAPNKSPTISVIAPPRSTATCAADRSAPPIGPYHWPYDSEVKVYFVREMFTPEQRLALVDAMSTWTEVGKQNGSGVKFTDAGETERKMSCRGCLTVGRRDVYKQDKHHYAFFYPMQQEQGRLLFSAWIDLDVGITKPTALKGFMVHELAHGLGLWDCTNCRNKQTIMNGFPGINKDNGLVAPSSCDVAAVRDVYNEERQLAAFNARGQEHPTISKVDSSMQASASKTSDQGLKAEKTRVSHIDFARRFDGAPALRPAGALQLQTTPSTSVFKLSPYGTDKRGFSQLHAQLPPDYLRWLTVSR